ncbi:hypothetical protein [Aquimarina rhabdastrellae]
MKNLLLLLLWIGVTPLQLSAQSNTHVDQMNWTKDWTNFEANKTEYPSYDEVIVNEITEDTFLKKDKTYLMVGDVYVVNGAILTIEEGTIIRCDYEVPANLIVSRGSKLIAKGTATNPIVFTSNKSPNSRTNGDWGGISILGAAPTNTVSGKSNAIKGNFDIRYADYGGNNPNEETTVMEYVRIEFGGKKHNQSKINALSLYALGKKSVLNNIMVSYSSDDSFEWHGGQLAAQNLISFKANDDDFDFTQGFHGELLNVMAIRHPYIASSKGSYAIEIDGYDPESDAATRKKTTVDISNALLLSLSDDSNFNYTKSAISLNNQAELYLNESIISGFSDVVMLDESYNTLALIQESFNMDNSFFNIHNKGVLLNNKLSDLAQLALKYNRFTKTFQYVDQLFEDPMNSIAPKFNLKKSLNNYMVIQ